MSSTASAAEQLSGINLPEIGHCGHCMPPITEADWNLIHASGFKIIRLPIDPDYIFSDGTVSDDAYEDLKGVLKKSNELGIMLDIDIHASRSEEHTSELQSLMRISYAVFCLKKKI